MLMRELLAACCCGCGGLRGLDSWSSLDMETALPADDDFDVPVREDVMEADAEVGEMPFDAILCVIVGIRSVRLRCADAETGDEAASSPESGRMDVAKEKLEPE